MNKKSYTTKIADSIRLNAGRIPTPRNAFASILMQKLFEETYSTSFGDRYSIEYDFNDAKHCGIKLEYRDGDPLLYFDGESRVPAFRYGRGYHLIDNRTFNTSTLKYFLKNPDDVPVYLGDRGLEVNHMVVGYGLSFRDYERQSYQPIFEAEVSDNLELITRSLNALHGSFVHACRLEGYRISVYDIPAFEAIVAEELKMRPEYDIKADEFFGIIASLPARRKAKLVEEVNQQAGFVGRTDFTEFL